MLGKHAFLKSTILLAKSEADLVLVSGIPSTKFLTITDIYKEKKYSLNRCVNNNILILHKIRISHFLLFLWRNNKLHEDVTSCSLIGPETADDRSANRLFSSGGFQTVLSVLS